MDTLTPSVNVTVEVRDLAGWVLSVQRGHNLVPTVGLNLLRDLLNGDNLTGITEFALGTGSTAAANGDTTLVAEVHRDTLTRTVKTSAVLSAQYFLSSVTLNGTTIREAGLFTDENTLFARYVLDTPIAKNSGIAVTFTWDITFSATV